MSKKGIETLVGLFVLLALIGPWIVPYDPLASNAAVALKPPSAAHWFGTDALGRDLAAGLIHGARVSLLVGLVSTVVALLIGVPLGLLAFRRAGLARSLFSVLGVIQTVPSSGPTICGCQGANG